MNRDLIEQAPFDPADSYQMSVEIVRKAMIGALVECALPVADEQRIAAQLTGMLAAFACVVQASALPGQQQLLAEKIMEQMPDLLEMAADMHLMNATVKGAA